MKTKPPATSGNAGKSVENVHGSNSAVASHSAPMPSNQDNGQAIDQIRHLLGEQHSGQIAIQREIGGRKGADPSRYGDWEKDGRCIDF